MTPGERFWCKVDKDGPLPEDRPELGPCWVWTASTFRDGYGQFYVRGRKRCIAAHIWSWENAQQRKTTQGQIVGHLCSRKLCVRPSHLREATRAENNQHLMGPRRHNRQKVRGVKKVGNRFYARARSNGVEHYVKGGFATAEEAGVAAAELRARLHAGNVLQH